jgi:hypothetical protein
MTTLRSRVYLAGALLALGTVSLGMLSTARAEMSVPQVGSDTREQEQDQNRSRPPKHLDKYVRYAGQMIAELAY